MTVAQALSQLAGMSSSMIASPFKRRREHDDADDTSNKRMRKIDAASHYHSAEKAVSSPLPYPIV